MFNGDFFKPQSIVSEEDIKALEAYNAQVNSGIKGNEAFDSTMKDASTTAQNLAKAAKGAAVDINAIPKASKAAAVGMKALSVAGNMLMSMAISFAITKLIEGVQWLATASERVAEKAREAAQATTEQAKESADAATELLELKKQLDDGTSSAEDLTVAFREQAKNIPGLSNDVKNLAGDYRDLASAIDEASISALEKARNDAVADVNATGKTLVKSAYSVLSGDSKIPIVPGSFHVGDFGDEAERLEKIISENAKIGSQGLETTVQVYEPKSKNAEDVYAYYQSLVKLQDEIEALADGDVNSKLFDTALYKETSKAIKAIETDVKSYTEAIQRLHDADAQLTLSKYLKTNDIKTKEDFDAYIQGIKDGTIGMVDGQEASEGYKQTLIDVANDAFPQFSSAAKTATQNTYELAVTVSDLEKVSDTIKPLGTAFKELSDDGYITIKTLKEIKDAADLSSEEWVEYEGRLLNAKAGSSEFNQIMSDLTYKILDNTFAGKDLNFVTEQQIAATLRENGVVNASAVAHEWLAKAKAKEKVASMELVKGSNLDIKALVEEASACNVTKNAYLELVAKEIIFNRNDLDVKDKVAKLNQIAIAAGVAGISIDNLNSKFETQTDKNRYVEESGGKVGYREVSTPEKSTVGWSLPYEPKLSSPIRELPQGIVEYELPDGTKTTDFSEYYASVEMGKLSERITNATNTITIPDFSGSDKGKNEALDNYLKDAENRYKIHQDETSYIEDLQYAYDNLTKSEEERLDITGKINEAYRDRADNRVKDIEHQIDLVKELQGEDADVSGYYDQIQTIAQEEAQRLRTMGYDDNSNEVQAMQKAWWDAQNNKLDLPSKQYENTIRDIEHARDMALEQNPYVDTTPYYKQMQDEYHKQAEYLRSLDPEKHKEEIQKLQQAWWDAQKSIADWSYSNSERWINERNTYNDWDLYNDNEIAAWERVLKRFQTEFPNELEKIKEIEQKIFDARKDAMEKAISDIDDYIDARNAYNDWDAYGDNEVKAIQRQTKIIEDAYKLRLLFYEEYVDRLEEQTQRIYALGKSQVDKHLSNIDNYIDARNHYNDWDAFGDSETNAIKRQLEILDEAYRLNLISLEDYTEKTEEYTKRLYSAAKNNVVDTISELVEDYEKIKQLESSQLESQKTLLQSYYNIVNAIAEAQHELNKELQASQSMYEYLNEDTRELLFNQEDYNALNEELLNIQAEADALQKQYQEDILNANAETIAEITSQYQMQYETMMKQYEIAKAELDVAKKRQKLDNVLAERNTRMFINGQWQWVAKTQDVINAQNELAEAEIERKKQEASSEQTEAINNFTAQINSLETDLNKVKKWWSDMQEMLDGESDEVAKALKEISKVSSPELKRIIETTGGNVGSFSTILSESTTTLSDIVNGDLGLVTVSTGIGTIIKDLENYSSAIQALINKLNGATSGSSSGRYLQVGADGNAPDGATIGDIIVTAGGNYQIVPANTPGASYNPASGHWSVKVGSSSSSGGGGSSSSGGRVVQVGSDGNAPSGTEVGDIVKTNGGNYLVVPYGTEGSTYNPASGLSSIKIDEQDASGTRYTSGGTTLMGEEGFEAFISNTGRLIPISQPTIGNIGAGGIVFNREQMANLRNLWDLSNLGKTSHFVSSSNANSRSTIIDNSIHIGGMTIAEQGNEDWINGLRRYVATHK